jgi:hypothetical protein
MSIDSIKVSDETAPQLNAFASISRHLAVVALTYRPVSAKKEQQRGPLPDSRAQGVRSVDPLSMASVAPSMLLLRRLACISIVTALGLGSFGCKSKTNPSGESPTAEKIVQASDAISVKRYSGPGFTVAYPTAWEKEASSNAVSLNIPTNAGVIFLAVGPASSAGDDDLNQFFGRATTQFPAVSFGSSEPTVYGAWRGDTITGQAVMQGQPWVVSVTGIHANDRIYSLIMVAPSQVMWPAYKIREAIANTVTFDHLPEQRHGTGTACTDCGAMLSSAMNQLTGTTVNGMQ